MADKSVKKEIEESLSSLERQIGELLEDQKDLFNNFERTDNLLFMTECYAVLDNQLMSLKTEIRDILY